MSTERAACWLVLGASSAIARAFAEIAAENGARIMLAGRDIDDLERTAGHLRVRFGAETAVFAFDAREGASHAQFAAQIGDRLRDGEVLNVLLAFAAMPPQAAIEAEPELAAQCIDTTLTGAMSVMLHLIPHFERQQGGKIAIIGSVAGDRGRKKNFVYGAAKAGLHVFTQGLRQRLNAAGVDVLTVKPGFVDTAMSWGVVKDGPLGLADPQDLAGAIWRSTANGATELYYPPHWRLVMTIIKLIPEKIFRRLNF